jgi:hypothetical protein
VADLADSFRRADATAPRSNGRLDLSVAEAYTVRSRHVERRVVPGAATPAALAAVAEALDHVDAVFTRLVLLAIPD